MDVLFAIPASASFLERLEFKAAMNYGRARGRTLQFTSVVFEITVSSAMTEQFYLLTIVSDGMTA